MKNILTLIVDDEKLAREKIEILLADDSDTHTISHCSDGLEALEFLESHPTDLMFLDIQMPGLTGFELLKKLDVTNWPVIVFTTAHDQYALEAFSVHAVDYLLKPYDKRRFFKALTHAKRQLDQKKVAQSIQDLVRELPPKTTYPNRLFVKETGKVRIIEIKDILWIESAGNYLNIFLDGENVLYRETLSSLESRLDPEVFLRIHRSVIANSHRFKAVEIGTPNAYWVVLKDGKRLKVGKQFLDRIRNFLNKG